MGHLGPNLASEQVPDPLPLAQSVRHPVEARLQQPDLASVVNRHVHLQVPLLDAVEAPAHRPERFGDRLC